MDKVYVVTAGDYSDYHICAIYSKLELADEYVKRAGKSYRREDFELDEPIPDKGLRVYMHKDGNVAEIYPIFDEIFGFEWFTRPDSFICKDTLCWNVQTEDEQRAIKVVNEKRAQILALDLWGDDEKVKEMVK